MDQRQQNHGEGDPEAAERFNDEEKAFVRSPRGKRVIRKGPQVRPDEQTELEDAERRAGERASGETESCDGAAGLPK
jgi:hypothetical protein